MTKDYLTNQLEAIIGQIKVMPVGSLNEAQAVLSRLRMLVGLWFGENDVRVGRLYEPHYKTLSGSTDEGIWKRWQQRVTDEITILLEEVELTPAYSTEELDSVFYSNKKVFVVHGHDGEMKEATSAFLQLLDLDPVVLHRQADGGTKFVFEKLEEHADVGFAVVLLSGEDLGAVASSPNKLRPRARQNVVLELGYFLGKLGRPRVTVLHRKIENFEFPTDMVGTLYKPFDVSDGWKQALARELKAAGYHIDGNRLLD